MLESLVVASSFTNFKLVWKTGTILAFVMVKCCSDLTLLHINNQHIFIQYHAAICIPESDGEID